MIYLPKEHDLRQRMRVHEIKIEVIKQNLVQDCLCCQGVGYSDYYPVASVISRPYKCDQCNGYGVVCMACHLNEKQCECGGE